MALQDDIIIRRRVCRGSGCHAVFWICRQCDRGQCYCSRACRTAARLQQRRSANCRHQQSPEGRLDHRDRQRRYRRRLARARVTDQGSFSTPPPARCLRGNPKSTPTAAQPGSAAAFPPRWPPPGQERWFRCIICGRWIQVVDPFSRFSRSGSPRWMTISNASSSSSP